ncbi:MAG: hypothetical protein ABJN36_09575 [Cyclobacteriaceae bacterium]
MDNLSPKTCIKCGKPLVGRTDKRFCDAYCRNSFNNQNKASDERYILQVNSQIRRNRRILKDLCPEGKSTVRRQILRGMGYDFRFFTNIYQSSKGATYYLCYDYGLTPILDNGKEKVVIVQKQDYMDQFTPVP